MSQARSRVGTCQPAPVVRGALAALVALVAGSAPAVRALSYQDASTGLPQSAVFGCNFPDNTPCNPSPDGGWSGIALGDFDGDGFDDIVSSGRLQHSFHAYVSDGAGGWIESSSGIASPDCHGRSDVAFADVNGDGLLDFGGVSGINGAPAVYVGDGTGVWTPSIVGLDAGNGEGFAFGDFDGDGLPDVAQVGHFSGGIQAWLNDDGEAWIETRAGLPTTGGGHMVTTGDLDCDGRDELVTTLYFDTGVQVWRLRPDGTWEETAVFPFNQAYGVTTADVNLDGHLDIVVATSQDLSGLWGSVHVFLGTGDAATFTESSAGFPVQDILYSDVEAGDLDADGDVDVVAGTWDGRVRVFLNDGTGTFAEDTGTGIPTLGQKIEALALGDIDGDCRLDIGVAAYSCGLRVYRRSDAPPCDVVPELGPHCLQAPCSGTVAVDASPSEACSCPPDELRYRFTEGGVLVQDWSPSPIYDAPATDAIYTVDVACAGDLGCYRSDVVDVTVGGGMATPTVEPALSQICEGESASLTVPGVWDSVDWSTDPPGQPGDGEMGADLDVAPTVTTTYTASVVDAEGCPGEAQAVVEVIPDPLPPPVEDTLRVVRAATEGLKFTWQDLSGTWGGYEVVSHARADGDPIPLVFDDPTAPLAGTTPPGVQAIVDDDALLDGSALTDYKVRATSPCLFRPGTACNGFPAQGVPCP